MPNWTTNYVKFTSESDAEKVYNGMMKQKRSYTKDRLGNIICHPLTYKVFTFETLIPYPSKEKCPEEFLLKNESISIDMEHPWLDWYNWNIQNWGVKWDASDVELDRDTIIFLTPWNKPNFDIFQKMCDKFGVDLVLQVNNEDGGWEENDYRFVPDNPGWLSIETSQWQIDENLRCNEEDSEDIAEDEA